MLIKWWSARKRHGSIVLSHFVPMTSFLSCSFVVFDQLYSPSTALGRQMKLDKYLYSIFKGNCQC